MAASSSQLTSASAISWSGGTLFNGYVLLIMTPPNTGGATWTRVSLKDCRPKLRVPTRVKVPIREGVYDPDTRVWQTTSIVPPNAKYSAFFYDDNDVLIAIGSALFTVTADPYTLAPPTLTAPTAETVSPEPEDVPSTGVYVVGAPGFENVTGTKDGVNTAFTISRTGTVVLLVWNSAVLEEGVAFTRVATAITMISPYLPGSTDTFKALIW